MAADPSAVPAPSASARGRTGSRTILCVLSLLFNIFLIAALILVLCAPSESTNAALTEKHYSGDASAADKVAIIRIAGMLIEGSTGYFHKQIEQAAKDKSVKAVVVRVESPGGTISASEDIHRALINLRDNTHTRFTGTGPKPLIGSMGTVAASGGYYVAMPTSKIVAEPTTLTGSIGVFLAIPNAADLASQIGVKLELIKAGNIKAGGLPLLPISPDERQPWQDMVDQAYDRFLTVVAAGRPALTKERLVNEKIVRRVPVYDEKGLPKVGPKGQPETREHTRYRADGGSFTSQQARDLGLIDDIADLNTAINLAAEAAHLTRYRTVTYERQKSIAELLLGVEAKQQTHSLSSETLAAISMPRVWYLTPGFETAGLLSPSP